MNFLLGIQKFITDLLLTLTTVLKIFIGSKFYSKPVNMQGPSSCIILGNGPSLTASIKTNENVLMDYDLVGVNHFAESELYHAKKPAYYVLNAPEMWMDDVEPFYYEKGIKLFNSIRDNTSWKINLFIPFNAKKYNRWQSVLNENPLIVVNFFNNTPVEGFKFFRYFCYNRQLGMPRPHNVIIPSLMIALSLKYKSIYLFGADHSWLNDISVTEDNEVLLTQKHFYDNKSAIPRPMDNQGKGARKLHEVLQKFLLAFQGYFEIKEYSATTNQKIINCTEGSFIDAFERSTVLKK